MEEAYAAPFAVRPFERDGDTPEDVQTVFEPDISVVCDKNKLDKHGCKGAPDIIVEILSPSTQRHDHIVKLEQYQRAGVREYWLVSPEDKTVMVSVVEDGRLIPQELYEGNNIVKVNILDGCFVELGKVFAD